MKNILVREIHAIVIKQAALLIILLNTGHFQVFVSIN